MIHKEERIGELMLLLTCVFEGLFPIVAKFATNAFPPIFFTAVSVLCAAFVFFCVLVFRRRLFQQISLVALGYAFGVTIFVVMGLAIVLIGVQWTSGINTTLLLQAEMLFTFLFASLFLGERLRRVAIFGACAVFLGTVFVLFNGTFVLNRGDLIIVFATALFPIGNMFAKKALELISADTLLFLRYLMGGCILLSVSFFFEDISGIEPHVWRESMWIFPVYVLLILVCSKICWYAGLKRLLLSKAVYIGSASPAFSLIFAYMFLREVPTTYQLLGFFLIVGGVYFLISKSRRRELQPDHV